MKKTKKVFLICVSALLSILLSVYLFFGFMSAKPWINGFTMTNGRIRFLFTDKDYILIDENIYLYREGTLSKLIENEFDSYSIDEKYRDPMEWYASYSADGLLKLDGFYVDMHTGLFDPVQGDSFMVKYMLVQKDGVLYNPQIGLVVMELGKVRCVRFEPYEK